MTAKIISLPPPLMTSDPGSYARATIVERKPQIIKDVLAENAYPAEIIRAVENFRDEIQHYQVRPLSEEAADKEFWNIELEKYLDKTWLELPWYFAETFFYRKLLEAVRYFQPGDWFQVNPFQKKKDNQIIADINRLSSSWIEDSTSGVENLFSLLLHSALWGNRADLSNFTVDDSLRNDWVTSAERDNILIDNTPELFETISTGIQRIDFINDNVGADIFFDLTLADLFLSQKWVNTVVFHLKNQPFFVSDAMPDDVIKTVEISKTTNSTYFRQLGKRLEQYLESQQLILRQDPFWTSCWMFRQMPKYISNELSHSDLVLLKGDVNYRRLLDDLHWSPTTRMEDITQYFPSTFAVIRTLKGEIIVSLQPGQAEELNSIDPNWMINGKRGLIQMVVR